MIKKTILLLALLGVQKTGVSQEFQWAKEIGITIYDFGNSITTDASGSVYTIGDFQGTVDFDSGSGTSNLTSNGNSDIFISKLDASGNFLWAKSIGGSGIDRGASIATDASGFVYITGSFQGIVDFDPGSGISNLTSIGNSDMFIAKLDDYGNFLWAKAMGGTSGEAVYSIAIDASGNVYVTGFFQGTVDFDPGSGTYNLTSNGARDIFVSKLNTSGNFLWAKAMGGIGFDRGVSITIDASGNVYITGYFQEIVDFDPGSGTSNLTSNGGNDMFISKLDASGSFLWAKAMEATGESYGSSITTDPSGNVYTTGYFSETIDFDPGSGVNNFTSNGYYDIFIIKLDASGNSLWAKTMGGTDFDGVYSIVIDASGSVYVTGYFSGMVDFDPGSGISNFTSNGNEDIFISKFDASGNFLWVKAIGGSQLDEGRSIATDASGSVYIMGRFFGAVDFDPGSGTSIGTVGKWGGYVLKLSTDGLGIEESTLLQDVRIYPNPTSGKVTLSSTEKIAALKVIDLQGKILFQKENDLQEVDLSAYEKGMYVLIITDLNGKITSKLIERM